MIDRLAWRSITGWLARYSRRRAGVRHCFIRHSTALAAQNPLVADYDLAFFVAARDYEELRDETIGIRDDLRKARVLDSIVLPATEAAYRLAATHYAHRSLYPLASWRCVYGEPLRLADVPRPPPPLDHSPEGLLYGYLVPVLLGKCRRHRFEKTLLRRKSERESVQLEGRTREDPPAAFDDVLADQVRVWDRFYGRLDLPRSGGPIAVRPAGSAVCEPFVSRWKGSAARRELPAAVESVWVYPSFNDDRAPRLVVNVEPDVSPAACERSLGTVLETFRELEFDLLVGTERSMLGRLGGLGRVSLLEPWLCRAYGRCLHGDAELGLRIREPTMAELEDKLRELFLYLSYRVFPARSCPFPLYRLCFTLDHLFRRSELVVDAGELSTLYGGDMLSETELAATRGKEHLLAAWRDLLGLDLFQDVG